MRQSVVLAVLCGLALLPASAAAAASKDVQPLASPDTTLQSLRTDDGADDPDTATGDEEIDEGEDGDEADALEGAAPVSTTGGLIYRLPVTVVDLTLSLTLVRCDVTGVEARPVLTAVPLAAATSQTFSFDPPRSSWWRSRDVTVELHDTGTIKSVNADVADQSLAVLTSAIKILGQIIVVGLSGSAEQPEPPEPVAVDGLNCRPEITAALAQAAALRTRITTLRGELVAQTELKALEDRRAMINALATDLAALETGPLKLTLTRTVEPWMFGDSVLWTGQELSPWFDRLPPAHEFTTFQLDWCASRSDVITLDQCAAQPFEMPSDPPSDECSGDCLILPTVTQARFWATAPGLGMVPAGQPPVRRLLAEATMPMTQWEGWRMLRFDAGIAESWKSKYVFDAFGRQTTYSNSATARALNAANGAESAVTAGVEAYQGYQGRDLAAIKAETETLQAQIALNKLEACRAIIAAGGYDCSTVWPAAE